jgi:hypothetical protein
MKKAPEQTEVHSSADSKADFKEFHALVRAFALRGHTLIHTKQGYTAIRWNLAKHLPTHSDAVAFLRQIGGRYEL